MKTSFKWSFELISGEIIFSEKKFFHIIVTEADRKDLEGVLESVEKAWFASKEVFNEFMHITKGMNINHIKIEKDF